MIVTVSGLSGLTKAYRSVLSASGSLLISGASRWLDANVPCGIRPRQIATIPTSDSSERRILRDTVTRSLIMKNDHQSGFETAVFLARFLLSVGDFRVA